MVDTSPWLSLQQQFTRLNYEVFPGKTVNNNDNNNNNVHNARSIKCISSTRLKKKLKIVKLKRFKPNVFGCLPSSLLRCRKVEKTFGLNLFNFTIFNFFNFFFSLVFVIITIIIHISIVQIDLYISHALYNNIEILKRKLKST